MPAQGDQESTVGSQEITADLLLREHPSEAKESFHVLQM